MLSTLVNTGCGRKFVLVTLALAVVNLTGCAIWSVTSKGFVPQEGQRGVLVFSCHELESLFWNSLYAKDDNMFSIDICQRQAAPPDSVDISTLDYVRLEDLSISFGGKGDPIRPTPEDRDHWREILLEDGFLHGPVHAWGWLHIPKSCDWIEITYTAILVSGDGLNEIDRRIVSQVLYRKHEREPFWVI